MPTKSTASSRNTFRKWCQDDFSGLINGDPAWGQFPQTHSCRDVSPTRAPRDSTIQAAHSFESAEERGDSFRFGRNSRSAVEMTHGEAPMTNEVRMTHDERLRPRLAFWLRAWSLLGHWALGIRHFAPGTRRPASYTLSILALPRPGSRGYHTPVVRGRPRPTTVVGMTLRAGLAVSRQ